MLIDADVGTGLMLAGQRVYTVFLKPRRFFENNGILYCSYMEENLFSTWEFKILGYLKTSHLSSDELFGTQRRTNFASESVKN